MASTHLRIVGGLIAAVVLVASGAAAGSMLGGALGDRHASNAPVGITVHGDWLLRVMDADGSLASEHEFRNALTSDGAAHLAGMLARERTQGFWDIQADIGGSDWLARESADEITSQTVDAGNGFRLSGSVTNDTGADASVQAVRVRSEFCLASTAPADAAPTTVDSTMLTGACNEREDFAEHTLAEAVSVLAGQLVQIQVTYTFD